MVQQVVLKIVVDKPDSIWYSNNGGNEMKYFFFGILNGIVSVIVFLLTLYALGGKIVMGGQ